MNRRSPTCAQHRYVLRPGNCAPAPNSPSLARRHLERCRGGVSAAHGTARTASGKPTSRLEWWAETGLDPTGSPTKAAFSASSWSPAAKTPKNQRHRGFGELCRIGRQALCILQAASRQQLATPTAQANSSESRCQVSAAKVQSRCVRRPASQSPPSPGMTNRAGRGSNVTRCCPIHSTGCPARSRDARYWPELRAGPRLCPSRPRTCRCCFRSGTRNAGR